MFSQLNNLIENEISELNLDLYSVIIGSKPSKGARSPKLWNKVYNAEKRKIRMVPLDVREENLEALFNYLQQDQFCLGGAVAVPYKEKIFEMIKKNVRDEVKTIGAVNCFYRSNLLSSINEFTGTNTDGEAAIEPIREYLVKNKNLMIGLLGFGGAGKAILAFLMRDFQEKHSIKLFNRSTVNIGDSRKPGLNIYDFNDLKVYLSEFDLIINATSLGHSENIYETPVDASILEEVKKDVLVYDIIYDPPETKFLKDSKALGLRTINGLRMNLIQAVLAYSYTNSTNLSPEEIYTLME